MKLRTSEVLVLVIILFSLLVGIYIYPLLPDQVASHWDASGQVNGYMSKIWGVALMPIIGVILFLVFLVIPRIDPKRENIEKFMPYFDNFIVLLFLFLSYIYFLTLAWNLNYRFDLVRWLSPAFAILFYYIGVLVGHAKSNWTIGIRTPWTLSSTKVWDETHRLGGTLFKITGVLALFGVIFPAYAIWLILVPAIATALVSVVYSYFRFQASK